MLKIAVVVLVYMALGPKVDGSADTMKTIMTHYAKAITECKKEMDFHDNLDKDLINFWKEDYQVTDRLAGCAIICLSTKLDLVEPDGSLHHGKTSEFAKKHGADENMVQQLIKIIKTCESTVPPNQDNCLLVLSVANCFKAEIHKLSWAPDMELIMGEILAEA